MSSLSLRVRLTLAFAGASAVLLAAVGVFIFFNVKSGLDASLDASLRSTARLYMRTADRGGPALDRALAVEGEPVQVVDSAGRVRHASPEARSGLLLRPTQLRVALHRGGLFERRERTRLIARPLPGGRALMVATSMRERERALEALGSVLLIGGPLILLVSSAAGYLVAAVALRRVDRMRSRADDIRAFTPAARLPVPRARDELGRLADTLNAMLDRLAASAARERSFLAEASHELRTPLAILKTEVEVALHDDADEAELRTALASIGEEADRLTRLAEDLLVILRGEDGNLPLDLQPVALDELTRRVASRFAVMTDRDVEADVERDAAVRADPARLEQVLNNLVDNALRHGDGPVRIVVERGADQVELHVTDTGPGFPAGWDERLFDPARRRAGGFGLGMAIVRAIVHAHGGEVGAGNTPAGADVWIRLPISGPAQRPRRPSAGGRSPERSRPPASGHRL
jgi:two-component system OmpR family sensor kinase